MQTSTGNAKKYPYVLYNLLCKVEREIDLERPEVEDEEVEALLSAVERFKNKFREEMLKWQT